MTNIYNTIANCSENMDYIKGNRKQFANWEATIDFFTVQFK